MIIYQPHIYSDDRVVWYGGESTQLHYEIEGKDENNTPIWRGVHIRTLMEGIPSGMSEMHAELIDYYNCCQMVEQSV
jgi:hypothetical protein